ncbi:hypothetical protein ACIRNI_23410 [Streptomyces sp. NPDC093546]|uniref:hypothetical protein n=1 Tax=Streptomyces sp. NPDC093546 TaxID=3366040 RepID=UPI00380A946E
MATAACFLTGSVGVGALAAEASAAPAITCQVTKGAGKTFGVSGSGFPDNEKVTATNSKGAVVGTTTTLPGGGFEFTGLPNDTYTVTSKFAKVTCAKANVPDEKKEDKKKEDKKKKDDKKKKENKAKEQYRKGHTDGFNAIKKNCNAKTPKNLTALDPNYEKGYNAGAKLAADKFCK